MGEEPAHRLAAGTGVVGFAAAALVGSGGRVIVSDLSPAMVEVAERWRPYRSLAVSYLFASEFEERR